VIATVVQDGLENVPFRLERRNHGNSCCAVHELASGRSLYWTDNQADEPGKEREMGRMLTELCHVGGLCSVGRPL
jgi:hypothetical protein